MPRRWSSGSSPRSCWWQGSTPLRPRSLMPERKQPHSVLLTNPIVRGPGYGIAASLASDGYPVHVTADHSLPGMFTSSRFFASVNRVDAPRGTLLHGVRIRPNSAAEDTYL